MLDYDEAGDDAVLVGDWRFLRRRVNRAALSQSEDEGMRWLASRDNCLLRPARFREQVVEAKR